MCAHAAASPRTGRAEAAATAAGVAVALLCLASCLNGDKGGDGGGSGGGPTPCATDVDCAKGWKCTQIPDQGSACAPAPGDGGKPACKPSSELCNAVDDDCDGEIDEGVLKDCNDGDACNGVEVCAKGACLTGKAPDCDDGEWCTVDSCEPASGCQHDGAPNGMTCSDSDACTGCALPPGVVQAYAVQAAAKCPEEKFVGCNALWMPGFFDGVSKHVVRFTFLPGAQLLWMIDGTATIGAVAEVYHLGDGPGALGEQWKVSFALKYRGQGPAGEGSGGPKLDDGWVVPKGITDKWHYFDIVKATMTQVGGSGKVELTQKPAGSVFPFQLGLGANGKTMAFSSSAWFDWVKSGPDGELKGHGDINVDADAKPPVHCDHCAAGKCIPGKKLDCDDAKPCTADLCAQGGCVHSPTSFGPCDDGIACTNADHCVEGSCVGKTKSVAACDDGDPCTADDCKNGKGCVHAKLTGACDDGDACTKGESCGPGGCGGGAVIACADDNPCSDDACDPAVGCVHPGNSLPCDDGDACTMGDVCKAGKCTPAEWATCDDGNPCTKDGCAAATGCAHLAMPPGPCDDGNACTAGDACAAGKCAPGGLVSCDDGDPCSDDSCDFKAGCQHSANTGGGCTDASACTVGDVCKAGVCQPGKPVVCDDAEVCTADSCDPGKGCIGAPLTGPWCSDDDACTIADMCQGGKCAVGKKAVCNDANPCTVDSCDASVGCKHLFLDGAACDDGSACTGLDQCKGGKCTPGAKLACNDANPCTVDGCDADSGCVHQPSDGPCDDGSACTVGEACKGGACAGGTALPCDDGNPCTGDACDAKVGCVFPHMNGKACNDGDACTASDACKAGACQGTAPVQCSDGNPCTIDTCNASGGCLYKNGDGIGCDDGNACTAGDKCKGGGCAPGAPAACDDGNPCTQDGCAAASGCFAKPADGKACDDGNACTAGDVCKGGKCAAGAGNTCDDGNPCTTDSCAKATGCSHAAKDGGACSDGSACTLGDLCKAGVCVGAKPIACDDGNICTSDFCEAKLGCVHPANDGVWCDDGDACSGDSICKGGACKGLAWKVCDDGKPCTTDACDPLKGCVSAPADGKPCSDGDACTLDDACAGATCQGKVKALCDDGNPCTQDGCDPKAGCWNKGATTVPGTLTLFSDGVTLANGAPAVPTWNKHPSWTANIPGATWIWTSWQVVNPVGDTVVTFSRSFTIPAGATGITGSLVIAADNSYVCTLNGGLVGQDATEFNYFESSKDTWPIDAKVSAGNNTLTCTVKNWAMPGGTAWSNPAGLLFRLSANWTQTLPCDDGSACTSGDVCQGGVCKGGAAKVCDDGNPCTTDGCDAKTGACTFALGSGDACNDGNACTGACLPVGVAKRWAVTKADTDPNVGWAGGGHALHLPGFCAGAMVRMTFDPDARFDWSSDGAKGRLHGTATVFAGGGGCNVGDKWFADVWFSFRGKGVAGQGSGGPKKELKDGVQPKALTDTWLYFDMIPGQATLTRVGNPNDKATLVQAPAGSMYPFQIGVGANGKSLKFGASSWFAYTHKAPNGTWSGQGDFNLDFHWINPAATCDQCQAGKCQGAPLSCDDKNPFTIDSCTPQGGCKHTPTNVCQAG